MWAPFGFSRFALSVALASLLACGDDDDPQMPMPDAAVEESCESDSECDDGRYCSGTETCDPDSDNADDFGCVDGTPPCGDSLCSEQNDECVTECPDADEDGHDEESCGGDDCDDNDGNRYPGNPEVCDAAGHDEDCDNSTLGPDADEDGQPALDCCQQSEKKRTGLWDRLRRPVR